MTEDEAKKKWCPAQSNGEKFIRCDSSECMAWRWVYNYEYPPHMNVLVPAPKPIVTKTDHGYCGLAGRLEG